MIGLAQRVVSVVVFGAQRNLFRNCGFNTSAKTQPIEGPLLFRVWLSDYTLSNLF